MSAYLNEEPEGQLDHGRKELRWNIPIPVRVKGTASDGKEFDEESITADASPSGMCVLLTVPLLRGDRVTVIASEEGFESPATVTEVSPLGLNMNRVRVRFAASGKFSRASAARKYIYDYSSDNWIGYIFEGIYYNSKHEPFGKLEGNRVVAVDSGNTLFTIRGERFYDLRGHCLGHVI
jgi:hypothetical protein